MDEINDNENEGALSDHLATASGIVLDIHGVSIDDSRCIEVILSHMSPGSSVAIWGHDGHALSELADRLVSTTAANDRGNGSSAKSVTFVPSTASRPAGHTERLTSSGKADRRLSDHDLVFADQPAFVIANEPDANLCVKDAILVINGLLKTARNRNAALLYTTRRTSQAVAADICFELHDRQLFPLG